MALLRWGYFFNFDFWMKKSWYVKTWKMYHNNLRLLVYTCVWHYNFWGAKGKWRVVSPFEKMNWRTLRDRRQNFPSKDPSVVYRYMKRSCFCNGSFISLCLLFFFFCGCKIVVGKFLRFAIFAKDCNGHVVGNIY